MNKSRVVMGAVAVLGFVACSDDAQVLVPVDSGGTPTDSSLVDTSVPFDANNDTASPVDASGVDAFDATDSADAALVCDADAGQVLCNGKCVVEASFTNDGKNCGVCGHDCLGAMCSNGLCAPQIIASAQANPIALAVNKTDVYWLDNATGAKDGTLMTCPVGGCPKVPNTLTTALDNPTAVVLDSASVYWLNTSTLGQTTGSAMKCPLAGCGKNNANRKVVASGLIFPRGLANDATNLYFGVWGPGFINMLTKGTISACSINGCGNAPTDIVTSTSKPWSVAVDGTDVYFTTHTQITRAWTAPLGKSTIGGTLLDNGTNASSIAVDKLSIFWTEPTKGNVRICSKGSCSNNSVAIFTTQGGADDVLTDGTGGVYWINTNTNDLMGCPSTGCLGGPIQYANTTDSLVAIALDDKYLYFATQDNAGTAGTIQRVAR